MRALVVFESMFGNTKAVARAVADGLGEHGEVDLVEVGAAGPVVPDDVNLLVVGGPTHAHGLSRPGTRKGAAADPHAPPVPPSTAVGLREWLATLERPRAVVAGAAFDTRFAKPRWLTGSAARGAEARLQALGVRMAVPAESFFVTGTPGPLVDRELERARGWGATIGASFAGAGRGRLAS